MSIFDNIGDFIVEIFNCGSQQISKYIWAVIKGATMLEKLQHCWILCHWQSLKRCVFNFCRNMFRWGLLSCFRHL